MSDPGPVTEADVGGVAKVGETEFTPLSGPLRIRGGGE